ncbi:MAG: hypothetical protein HC825_08925 [Oscillatoriales cyanobacterium RM1_1_9]|nr:hypothetical protein [Oscillatoriales cyanobacterium SM2_3_0]NJO71755.1 hypothetical protein [Oscillatoriales cyanobacterium RM1_1_9]
MVYTAISFAPVQGFIEKSRKLRDLFGASQILSYLSMRIVERAGTMEGVAIISPAIEDEHNIDPPSSNMDITQGMPNRILIKGKFSGNDAKSAIAKAWGEIVSACRSWIENALEDDFAFSEASWGRAWTKWKIHAWEVFWGEGSSIPEAMRDLETNKLRRDWTVPNWNGESSSLSGVDAIAYPNIDNAAHVGRNYDAGREKEEIKKFYEKLAKALESTKQKDNPIFLDPAERLSIPELIKRLVTHHEIAKLIDPQQSLYTKSFREMLRIKDEKQGGGGYWTGWFMGDGDQVGKHLKSLKTSEAVERFSHSLRRWGRTFQKDFALGRVVYAGGDDFFGVVFGTEKQPQKTGQDVVDFLIKLQERWESGNLGVNLSVGFVWAGHSVPQRDVLQHCREAEKRAKSLGRNRVTIRILFNNGQFVQWTTPWECLQWLNNYKDREDNTRKQNQNWNHIYSDLAQLKARHAIPLKTAQKVDETVALAIFKLYFGEDNAEKLSKERGKITGSEDAKSVIEWIDGMIQVGWKLCSNS